MKSWISKFLLAPAFASLPALAADDASLTYTKIKYIADNCGSIDGFAAWLKTKPGVADIDQSDIYLTSLPAKSDVSFRLNGKPMRIRVSPTMTFDRVKVAYQARAKKGSRAPNVGSKERRSDPSPDQVLRVEDVLQMLAEDDARVQHEIKILDAMLKDYEAFRPGRTRAK